MNAALPVSLDTETELITFDQVFPRLVCAQWASEDSVELLHHTEAEETLDTLFTGAHHGDFKLVLHNATYDFGVTARRYPRLLSKIFCALDEATVTDTMVKEQLIAIADGSFEARRNRKGSFSLGTLAKDYCGISLDKSDDSWRLRYGELINVPVTEWPAPARHYATADAVSTLKVSEAQAKHVYQPPDEPLQLQSSFALGLMTAYGVVTDEEAVDAFELRLLEVMAEHEDVLKRAEMVRENGSRNMKAIYDRVDAAYMKVFGRLAPRTAGGSRDPVPQTDAETIEEVSHVDPVLEAQLGWTKSQYYISHYASKMRMGAYDAIRSDFRNLVESGRTSSGARRLDNQQHGLNWQGMSRELDGGRECVVARKGNVLIACDYSIAELRALAQVCFLWFGWSRLREAICAGQDPHTLLASQMMGISYEEGAARKKAKDEELIFMRDFVAKHMNFGLCAGMGPPKFCRFVRKSTHGELHLEIDRSTTFKGRTIPSATELKSRWMDQWPEMRSYFGAVSEIVDADGYITQIGSGRRRGGVRFTDAANGYFQGYVADIAKRALYLVTRACYVPDSNWAPLYGCRPILFIHDEIVLEAPEDQASEAAICVKQIMEEVEAEWMPDVPPDAEVKLCRRWRKQAKPVIHKGQLIPWEDREKYAA